MYDCPRIHHPPHEPTPPDTLRKIPKRFREYGRSGPPSQIHLLMSLSQESPPPILPIHPLTPPHHFAHPSQCFTMPNCPPIHPRLSHPNSPKIRSMPAQQQQQSAAACSKEHHGVKPTSSIKTNRSLLVASCVKAFPGRPTIFSSTIPRAAQLDGDVIRCNQCHHLAFMKCSGIYQHVTNPLGFVLHACHPPLQSLPHPTHHSHD